MPESNPESSNKTHILIIGASSSIGCEVIREVAGENTVILAHCHSGAGRLADLQAETRGQLIPVPADLSTGAGVDVLLDTVGRTCETPAKVVFLAAPAFALTRFKDLKWEDFQTQLDIQLAATVKILNCYLPRMALARRGRVVLVLSSYTAGKPPSAMAHYITAKYAALGLMKSLAAEYAEKKICINAVSPSMVETSFLSKIPPKIVEFTAQAHPLKRNARPSDIAPLVKFLLSDEAAYLTGVNIPVTGGL